MQTYVGSRFIHNIRSGSAGMRTTNVSLDPSESSFSPTLWCVTLALKGHCLLCVLVPWIKLFVRVRHKRFLRPLRWAQKVVLGSIARKWSGGILGTRW